MGMTPKQKKVYDFLKEYIEARGFSPSYHEIREHLGLRSLNSVQKYLKQLESKGLVRTPWGNMKRAIQLTEEGGRAASLPLLGAVAAGSPIEPVELSERIDVPETLLAGGGHFVLRVKGQSMVDDGINDGDLVVLRKQEVAENGQTVVALVDGEATIKRFYRRGRLVELKPSNEALEPIVVEGDRVEIEGIVVALVRRY